MSILADPQLQKWGGQIFSEIFERSLFRRFPKKFQHFPKKFHLSLKISNDLFSCFNVVFVRGGAKFVADIDTGEGPKSLHFDKFTMLSLLFLPPKGAKLHCQL